MSKSKIDILKIDDEIKKSIKSETKNILIYKTKLQNEQDNIKKEELRNKIEDITSGAIVGEYIYLTEKILQKYSELFKIPVSVSFFEKTDKNDAQIEDIIKQYIDIAKNYIDIKSYKNEKNATLICECGNNNFIYTDNTMTCENCSIETVIQSVQNSFKDIDRLNMSQKYKYKKKVHFRDTINQYQGKQKNKLSDDKVYKDLEEHFLKMGLININGKTWYERHSKITKDIVYMVLGETNNNKRYEDINYIHNYFTGIPCPDISKLEYTLLQEFDMIVDVYESLNVDRKNFLNSKYVLYQLLRINGIKVDDKDFDLLKTRERLLEHDLIWQDICNKLEYPYKPLV